MKYALAAGVLFWSGCGGYADFTLPPLSGGPYITFRFDERPTPVLGRDEFVDALNPSVLRGPAGLVNYFSAFDGRTWHTMTAASTEGLRWDDGKMILSPDLSTWEGGYIAANGAALLHGSQVWYWYQAGPKPHPRIGLMRTRQPVLDYGPYMSWDERATADPDVIRIGSYFYMYYLGQDRAEPPRQRLGVARSTDGIHWEKWRGNPILELGAPGTFDENSLGEPAVWSSHGFYWMLYTGRDVQENRRMGLARSTDGVHWRKLAAVFSGAHEWDSKVICDPSVLVENGEIRVWFGGGDVASPDENLHGQIGYGTLHAVDATLAK